MRNSRTRCNTGRPSYPISPRSLPCARPASRKGVPPASGVGDTRREVWSRAVGPALAAVVLSGACGAPAPGAPSAVVTSDPEAVCLGDDYRTPIVLDASDSAPRLTLVPAMPDPDAPPLGFEWDLSGSAWALLEGDLDGERLVVAIAGDRPLHVELTVREPGGGVATTLHTVAVTEPDPAAGVCVDGEAGP